MLMFTIQVTVTISLHVAVVNCEIIATIIVITITQMTICVT